MPNRTPHPGDMTHMIAIGETVNAINENGYPVEADSTVCTVHAAIEDASGRWFFGGDADAVRREIRFVIRWRSDVAEGMWVEYDGKRRTITQITEYDYRKRYMLLATQNIEGVR